MSEKLLQELLKQTNESINKEVKRVRSEVWKGASNKTNGRTIGKTSSSFKKTNETAYAK